MSYPFSNIGSKWQQYWDEHETFKAVEDSSKRKLYVLDPGIDCAGDGFLVLPHNELCFFLVVDRQRVGSSVLLGKRAGRCQREQQNSRA